VYHAIEVENELKMLFRLSPSVCYYSRTFGTLLNSGSRVAGGMFGQYPVDEILVKENSM
jgi:hypothetical protein